MMKWQVIISWSIFPLIELARRRELVDFETSEALNCINDSVAKVRA